MDTNKMRELKALAEAVRDLEDIPDRQDELEEAEDALWLHMHCHTILGLLAEIDQAAADGQDVWGLAQSRAKTIDQLKAENEALRAVADLQKLLPEVADALEELEVYGQHSDQGYRSLKDWYRKVALAYRIIQGPMFGAEHGELVSQNTWLRKMVEHYAEQHAPLEPIPDRDGWSTRLPGYDLPALLRDAERYRWLRQASATDGEHTHGVCIDLWENGCGFEVTLEEADAAVDAAMAKEASQ